MPWIDLWLSMRSGLAEFLSQRSQLLTYLSYTYLVALQTISEMFHTYTKYIIHEFATKLVFVRAHEWSTLAWTGEESDAEIVLELPKKISNENSLTEKNIRISSSTVQRLGTCKPFLVNLIYADRSRSIPWLCSGNKIRKT